MKRYLYRSLLAAAWMAENHRLRFTDRNGARIHPLRDCYSVKWYFDETPGGAKSAAYFGEIYFIHPDSLNLLEPKEGDVYLMVSNDSNWGEAAKIPANFEDIAKRMINDGNSIIIQRNGLPFMWPESEAV